MIAVELRKQIRRARTLVALAVMVAVPVLITLAFKLGGPPHDRRGGDLDFFRVATRSGLDMPLAALTAVSQFLLVVVVALFAGESLTGEASWGTLRYLLVRPVSRPRLLSAKLSVASLLALLATALVTAAGLVAGVAAFGWHPMVTPDLNLMSQSAAGVRLALATAYVAWNMAAVVSFSFLVSTMTDAVFGAVAAGIGLAIISEILDGISAVGSIRYGLPTHYWQSWTALFLTGGDTAEMVRGVLIQAAYSAVFLAGAWWWFGRKDVLS